MGKTPGPEFRIKRVYEAPSAQDGQRYLVDRLWPRGVKKEALHLAGWPKEVAPSPPLRKWFGHEPAKWTAFCRRYRAELEKNPAAWKPLLAVAKTETVTLLFAARNLEFNHAVVLMDFLREKSANEASQPDSQGKQHQS